MKKFNLQEFNINGQKFHIVSLKFTLDKKLEVVIEEETVQKTRRQPSRDSDFCSASFSYNSKRFYELNGVGDVNNLFAIYGQFTAYFYVLPENLEEVKPQAIEEFMEQVRSHSETLTQQAIKLAGALALVEI